MTESMDFAALGDDAAANEPPRNMTLTAEETEAETVKNGSQTVSGDDSHPVDAADFAGAFVTALDAGIVYAFGKGGDLTQTEKNGFLSLFERTANHFGLTAHISGGKGLFLMAIGKVLAVMFPRLADEVKRAHFAKVFFGSVKDDDAISGNGSTDESAGGDDRHGEAGEG